MKKTPKAPDSPPATDGPRRWHPLKPRTWPVGWISGIVKEWSAAASHGRTLGPAMNRLRQARGHLGPWPGRVWHVATSLGRTLRLAMDRLRQAWGRLGPWPGKVWRVATALVVRSGFSMLLLLVLAVYAAILVGDRAYRNLQLHYQTQMLRAVAEADVIHDICRQRSDIFWEDCSMPAARGEMSDQFVWAMLVSADVIDPLSVALPTQLRQLAGSDAGAAVVVTWLKNQDRTRLTGVPLLIATSEFCESPDGNNTKAPALNAIVTASLADIYEPLPGGDAWLKPEIFKALGLTPPAQLAPRQPVVSGGVWPAPADLRGKMVASDTNELDERRAGAWRALVGTTEVSANEAGAIEAFLGDSIDRRAVPDQIGDADVVATLFALGGLIDRKTNAFRVSFVDCALNNATQALESDQKQAMVANLEKLALYIAGQIRISPEVKRARFWVSVYTGHEQRLIFIMAAFGMIVVLARITVFLVSTVIAAVSRRPATLIPFDSRPVSAAQRDNEFDQLASTRWPIRIAVAILPAIGFIGTVRGIMLALSGADAIVWAETVNQRSAAISGLSADLGLAFATTLLALLFGALLTILVAMEMALGERLLIQRYAHLDARGVGDG